VVTVEFYKMAVGGGVGRVLETLPMVDFADKDVFNQWAQSALPSRRGNPQVWEWPEAVRACDSAGAELFKWTLWDQTMAGKRITNA
jgi:hypothetical protein